MSWQGVKESVFAVLASWREVWRELLLITALWGVYILVFGGSAAFGARLVLEAWVERAAFWSTMIVSGVAFAWACTTSSLPMWLAWIASLLLGLAGFDSASRLAAIFGAAGIVICIGATARPLRSIAADTSTARRKPFTIVLVFRRVSDEYTWSHIVRTVLSASGLSLSGAPLHLRAESLRSGEFQIRPFAEASDLPLIARRLSSERFRLSGEERDSRIEIYRQEEFDLVRVIPPADWPKHQLLQLQVHWHRDLDPCGLRVILGGHGIDVPASAVRTFREDAELGYSIAGLEFCSPNPAIFSEVPGESHGSGIT